MSAELRATGITAGYGGDPVIRDISVHVALAGVGYVPQVDDVFAPLTAASVAPM